MVTAETTRALTCSSERSTAPRAACRGHWPCTAAVALLGRVLGGSESQAQHLLLINSATAPQALF